MAASGWSSADARIRPAISDHVLPPDVRRPHVCRRHGEHGQHPAHRRCLRALRRPRDVERHAQPAARLVGVLPAPSSTSPGAARESSGRRRVTAVARGSAARRARRRARCRAAGAPPAGGDRAAGFVSGHQPGEVARRAPLAPPSAAPRSASRSVPYSRSVSSIRNRAGRRRRSAEQRLVDQRLQERRRCRPAAQPVAPAQDRARGAATASRRRGKTAKRSASITLGVGEQVPAPLDDRAQRAVPWHGGPAAAGEQPEPVGEPGRDLGGRHAPAGARRPARWPAAGRRAGGRSRRRGAGRVTAKSGSTARARSTKQPHRGVARRLRQVARPPPGPAAAAAGAAPRRRCRAAPGWWRARGRRGSGRGAPRSGRRPASTRCSQLSTTSSRRAAASSSISRARGSRCRRSAQRLGQRDVPQAEGVEHGLCTRRRAR